MKSLFYIVSLFLFVTNAQASWLVQNAGGRITVKKVNRPLVEAKKELRSLPLYIGEGISSMTFKDLASKIYTETLYRDDSLPVIYKKYISKDQAIQIQTTAWPGSEVRDVVVQGPASNRIDLTIVGDGYTQAEKEKFFADAKRTSDQLFSIATFSSYLPLFNVHAVFVPSNESGLTDVKKVDTALGLYRDPPGSKRAIMPGNPTNIDRAVALTPDTDYAILLANDDFYGGLGGQYATTTRSERSGIMVLRHELGHNFGQVGEEYDNGSVYTGANSSPSTDVTWKQWLDDKSGNEVYETKILAGDYIWQNLKGNPYSSSFTFPTGDYYLDVFVSGVGWATANDVSVSLDKQTLNLQGEFTNDRSFYDVNTQAKPGVHLIDAKELVPGDHTLAFIEVFALPSNIIKTTDHVAAYATFDESGNKTYRPTYDSCIMRNMLSDHFCSVDKENFWHRFLSTVKLVDEVRVTKSELAFDVEAVTPALKGLQYSWYRIDGGSTQKIANITSKLSLPANAAGTYRLVVDFKTDEVRDYTPDFEVTQDFTVQ